MFVNCKHCNALVATDPATDLPPERCPRCAGVLRAPGDAAANVASPAAAAPADATPTISSLLLPPEPPAQLATRDIPAAAAPAAGEASTTVDVESAREAVVAEPEVAVSVPAPAPAEEVPAPPAPEPPVDLPAEDAIVHSGALPDAGDDGTLPPPPVEASPTRDVADDVDMRASVPGPSGEATLDAAAADVEPADAEPESAPASVQAPDGDGRGAADATAGPSFLPARPRASRAAASRRWLPAAAIAALALLLGLQVLLADRARLAADAQWRPLVVSLCGAFGCEVPAWREPAAFTLLAREVRPHPQVPGALRVDAVFRNDARWPQPWPRLLLTLSDIEGRPVAARAFDAREYLAEPAAALLDSGGTARIRIDLREPAAATVSYSFDFR